MTQASKDRYLSRCADVKSAMVDDEAVLLNVETGDCYSLNKVGAWFWERANGTMTISGLAREAAAVFEVTYEQAEEDLLALARDLVAERLASLDGQPSPVR